MLFMSGVINLPITPTASSWPLTRAPRATNVMIAKTFIVCWLMLFGGKQELCNFHTKSPPFYINWAKSNMNRYFLWLSNDLWPTNAELCCIHKKLSLYYITRKLCKILIFSLTFPLWWLIVISDHIGEICKCKSLEEYLMIEWKLAMSSCKIFSMSHSLDYLTVMK